MSRFRRRIGDTGAAAVFSVAVGDADAAPTTPTEATSGVSAAHIIVTKITFS